MSHAALQPDAPFWPSDDVESRELLHLLTEMTNDGIWDWDLQTNRHHYSPRWLEFVGLDHGDAPEHLDSFLSILHPDDAGPVWDRMQAFLRGEASHYRMEFRLRHRDGSWRWILSRAAVMRDEAGRAYRVAGTHTDITERIETEERLERLVAERTADLRAARDKAELAVAATAKFLAATSHDIRQPLQAMALLLEGLRDQVDGTAGGKTLHAIQRALVASMELLDSLLEFSRLDAGALKPMMSSVDLNEVLDSAVMPFAAEAANRGIELVVVSTTATVTTDAQLIGRILRNLLSNAIKYTNSGKVLVGCRREGENLRLEIWDTGCGIPPDKQQQIFWEFVQLGPKGVSGLGLGLAIVDRLARLLNHRLDMRSWPGMGSVFSLLLSRSGSPPTNVSASEPPFSQLPLHRIALLEDSTDIASAFHPLLADWGCETVHATTIEELLTRLDGRAPDFLIADWHLANNGDGFEAFERLESQFYRRLPGIILTGDYDFEALARVNRSKRRVLHKPVLPAILNMVVRAEMEKSVFPAS